MRYCEPRRSPGGASRFRSEACHAGDLPMVKLDIPKLEEAYASQEDGS
jgi:hypothetical protein